MSSLYWRAVGEPEQAVRCLLHCYDMMPAVRRETALFSLVQIVATAGHRGNGGKYEDAETLARLALAYSPRSPTAHFVMGIVYFYQVTSHLYVVHIPTYGETQMNSSGNILTIASTLFYKVLITRSLRN